MTRTALISAAPPGFTIADLIGGLLAVGSAGVSAPNFAITQEPNAPAGFTFSLSFIIHTTTEAETISIDLSIPTDTTQDPISLQISPGASSVYPDLTAATDPKNKKLDLTIQWPAGSHPPTIDGTLEIPF